MLRLISEQTLEIDKGLCACIIDWQKAFDKINADPKGNWYQLV
jgi:hypothetical protein